MINRLRNYQIQNGIDTDELYQSIIHKAFNGELK